jgi:hypothetical protein
MTSKRGEVIKQDIYSVLLTAGFTALSFIITELINLVPTWELGAYQALVVIVLTLLLDLAKKYSKVTNY